MLTLQELRGRVMDLDSHEMAPDEHVGRLFGERGLKVRATDDNPGPGNQGIPLPPNVQDDMVITEQAVWETKGGAAPGAIDFDRRPEVLDAMGINRQMVFPGMALIAQIHTQGGLFEAPSPEVTAIGWEGIDAHNDWAASVTNRYDRIRVVGVLGISRPGATPETLADEAKDLIAKGIKAIQLDSSVPPGGVLPSDPSLDRLYSIVSEANVPLVLHPPSGVGYVNPQWRRLDPIDSGVAEMLQATENFIRKMVLGGVFERHPNLRFGAIELGSAWFGPLSDWLDVQVLGNVAAGFGRPDIKLPLKPSEYLARNVRVTPFNFEPVERWLERYPHLQDCYCYSSDYPHQEGRPWSLKEFYENIKGLGDDVVEKFFCKNAELLLP